MKTHPCGITTLSWWGGLPVPATRRSMPAGRDPCFFYSWQGDPCWTSQMVVWCWLEPDKECSHCPPAGWGLVKGLTSLSRLNEPCEGNGIKGLNHNCVLWPSEKWPSQMQINGSGKNYKGSIDRKMEVPGTKTNTTIGSWNVQTLKETEQLACKRENIWRMPSKTWPRTRQGKCMKNVSLTQPACYLIFVF